MTDLEFYELRYSGKAASVVRGFRAVYLGLFFNCFIMGMVTLAACKIANILFAMPPWQTILICGLLNVVFAAQSGLWGVLVIDMIQFFIKMTAVIAAACFSLKAVARQAGLGDSVVAGMHQVVHVLGSQQVNFQEGAQPVMSPINGHGQPILDIMPNFSMSDLALMIFILPIAIDWWANWYPGAEPGGGSYIAQRMLASKTREGFPWQRAVLQLRALRPAALAVDYHGVLLDPDISGFGIHPTCVSPCRPDVDRSRQRISRDAEIPAGRIHRPDGRRTDRGEFFDHPDALELGLILPGA